MKDLITCPLCKKDTLKLDLNDDYLVSADGRLSFFIGGTCTNCGFKCHTIPHSVLREIGDEDEKIQDGKIGSSKV
jgi:C4-type Zn-finger protein